MVRLLVPVLFGALVAALGFGCNAIVGNDEHSLDPCAACPYACVGGVCVGTCSPGGTRCNGNTPQTCDPTGSWQSAAPCPKVCSLGQCADRCVTDSKQCNNTTPQTCDSSGSWVDGAPCPFVCQAGACGGECVPNQTRCTNNAVESCDANGRWQKGATCPYVCSNGACAGSCVPSSVRACGSAATCNAGGSQTCEQTGNWGACNPADSPCAAAPTGWSPVALTTGTCPSGFALPQLYVATVTAAPYTCSCTCGGTQTCRGTGILNQYMSGGCMGSPIASNPVSFSTACGAGGPAIAIGNGYVLSNVAFGPGPACSASPLATNRPPPAQTTITVCKPVLACPNGACLSAAQTAALCVSRAGDVACPGGFPKKTLAALGVTDTRACGACACGSTLGCTFQSLLIDNDSACSTANPYNFTEAANSCVAAPNSFPFNASRANATVTGSGTCVQTSPSAPTGGVTLAAASTITVCCP